MSSINYSLCMKYEICRLIAAWIIASQIAECQYDLDFWPIDPKIYRSLLFIVFYVCNNTYKRCRLITVTVIVLQQSVAEYSSVTLTFWPQIKGAFLSLSSNCVWSMNSLCNQACRVIALQQRVDGQTDKVITIGLPHLWWRGLNKVTSLFGNKQKNDAQY